MADYNLGPFRIRPRGEFKSSESYRYLDLVTYNGGSYVCINLDTIDGIAVTGVLPEGQASSESYWQCIAHKGDKGDTGDQYKNFITITDGLWDYSKSDKIIIPDNGSVNLAIINVYDGCCGVVLSSKELDLPYNSEYSIDFNYISCSTNQYYMYTFIYTPSNKFSWNRTVINK